jgi:hypothetical protein
VSHDLVAQLRPVTGDSASEESAPERTYTTKHSTTATMNTENIGRPRMEETAECEEQEVQPLDFPRLDTEGE